ncbi:hypothetical protein JRQ81_007118 [Phrynocephalus forsythii]|uniref:Uncharacterized protein n=1 Tax=Phrynocephalus forsythii TaxID=171643 RepID=A0A9Q1ATI7_9SAUR|nr:hypothetical protein JRQ81_007118 [Phrynocephalus forsythii]
MSSCIREVGGSWITSKRALLSRYDRSPVKCHLDRDPLYLPAHCLLSVPLPTCIELVGCNNGISIFCQHKRRGWCKNRMWRHINGVSLAKGVRQAIERESCPLHLGPDHFICIISGMVWSGKISLIFIITLSTAAELCNWYHPEDYQMQSAFKRMVKALIVISRQARMCVASRPKIFGRRDKATGRREIYDRPI